MLGAIYVGLSGMDAYSKGLQTISNNVANLNTLGFKAANTSFSDIFNYGGSGLTFGQGTDEEQAGNGVQYNTPETNFTQGDLQQSDGDLDLAIQGSGFLVMQNGDNVVYGRTGQFSVDNNGYIVEQGTQNRLTILNDKGQAVAVNINDKKTNPPVATTTVKFADNLSSTGTTATVSDIDVYDSLGGKHVWQAQFNQSTTDTSTWNITVTDSTGATVGTGALKFDGGDVDPTTDKLVINYTPTTDAEPLAVTLDFSSGITDFSSGTNSTLRAASVDGNGAGALTSVTVDDTGQIKLTYDNSQTVQAGAIALADFANPQALEQDSGGVFTNKGSEHPRLLASGVDGAGTLVSREVEASNVDLSQEFGDLILIQRGFQASSQVVSIANDMIQQLFGIRGQG